MKLKSFLVRCDSGLLKEFDARAAGRGLSRNQYFSQLIERAAAPLASDDSKAAFQAFYRRIENDLLELAEAVNLNVQFSASKGYLEVRLQDK